MFDVIKRMFGEGKIRFRGVTTDGISFTGSIPLHWRHWRGVSRKH